MGPLAEGSGPEPAPQAQRETWGPEHPQLKGAEVRSETPRKASEQSVGEAAANGDRVEAAPRPGHRSPRQPLAGLPEAKTRVIWGDFNRYVFLFMINLEARDTGRNMK